MSKIRAMDASIGAKNKVLILSAAEKAFAQNGLKGTSVQQIADRAGLPKTNVLYYFKTKQELYMAVLQQILDTWNSAFDKATVEDDPAIVLAEYIAEKMEISRSNPYASKVFAMEILNGATNVTDYFREEHGEWMRGRVAVIEGWIEQGKMHTMSAEYLLYHIWACTQHYADFSAQIRNLRGSKMLKQDFAEATQNLVQLILGGCGLSIPEKYKGN